MSKIKDALLKLIQDINSIGNSFPMLYIKLDFIEKMEFESNVNPVFYDSMNKIEKLIKKASMNIEDYTSLVNIKNIYSEAYIFSKLKSSFVIEKIIEKKHKTPDYKVKFRESDIFVELKSLNMFDGNIKHKDIMEKSFDSKIEAERQIQKGAKVGLGEQVVQPYLSANKTYDPYSVRLVIESLIDKINQNIKKEQYFSGDTVLLIDLSDQLLLVSKPTQAIQEKYYDDLGRTNVSGELWNVAFGKLNDIILRPAEFEGADNSDGKLLKEGILVSHPYIRGLIFHMNEGFYSFGVFKHDNLNVVRFLEYLSTQHTFQNDITP